MSATGPGVYPVRPRIGLCSVTLRASAPTEVLAAAVAAGLESVEWGSDVHVRSGDLETARRVGEETRNAGLVVSSYGSYVRFPWARGEAERFDDVLASALALAAPRIRIWTGPTSSADTSDEGRRETVRALSAMARQASDSGVELAIEYHLGTLADTAESTIRLLEQIGESNVSTYWQPAVGASDETALADLAALGPWTSAAHVFSWDASFGRFPLASRSGMWTRAVEEAVALPAVTDLLLEFLPEDDIALLASEAAELRRWRDRAVSLEVR